MPVGPSGAQRASRRRSVLVASVLALGAVLALHSVATAATAPWLSVEQYYLRLLNCTRTGGWVRSDGSCAAYGSGRYSAYVAPIRLSTGLSDRVARPWARYLAIRARCTHGDPSYRLRSAGYYSWTWAENIGCRDGYSSAYRAVLASHLKFQSERSWNGGHWRNIKNSRFRYVGIGVWKYYSRIRLVTDFYRP